MSSNNWVKKVTLGQYTINFSDNGFCKFTRKNHEGKEQTVCTFSGSALVDFIEAAELFYESEDIYRNKIAPEMGIMNVESYAKNQVVKHLEKQISTVQASLDALKFIGISDDDSSITTLKAIVDTYKLEKNKQAS